MELWASGFNAFGQLDFAKAGSLTSEGMPEQDFIPKDLNQYERILSDKEIDVLKTSLSATLVRTSSKLLQAGSPDHFFQYLQSNDCQIPIQHIAQTNSEKLAAFKDDTLSTYDSLDQYQSDVAANSTAIGDVTSIVANDTSFYALTKNGKVFSWGDVRHESSLGREVTEECPADAPSVIEDLATDPITGITKISAGGYIAGALTNENDLYVWGGRQGQETLLPDMGRTPESVDIDGEDILDFAVGDKHIVVLTMSHRLWVIGNFNGQTGDGVQKTWKEITLPLKKGQKVVKVYAGYRASFALVDGEESEEK